MATILPPQEGKPVWLVDWRYALLFVILLQPGWPGTGTIT